jgi:hypothetical protein
MRLIVRVQQHLKVSALLDVRHPEESLEASQSLGDCPAMKPNDHVADLSARNRTARHESSITKLPALTGDEMNSLSVA